jgi:hypothetical protein
MYPLGCPTVVCHVLLVEADNGLVLVDSGSWVEGSASLVTQIGRSELLALAGGGQ